MSEAGQEPCLGPHRGSRVRTESRRHPFPLRALPGSQTGDVVATQTFVHPYLPRGPGFVLPNSPPTNRDSRTAIPHNVGVPFVPTMWVSPLFLTAIPPLWVSPLFLPTMWVSPLFLPFVSFVGVPFVSPLFPLWVSPLFPLFLPLFLQQTAIPGPRSPHCGCPLCFLCCFVAPVFAGVRLVRPHKMTSGREISRFDGKLWPGADRNGNRRIESSQIVVFRQLHTTSRRVSRPDSMFYRPKVTGTEK